jgi:N6-adenosine-specific RNA methylase IME4
MSSGLEAFFGRYDVVYGDPPWYHYGNPSKNAAAGKHYDLMTDDQVASLPVRNLFRNPRKGVLFLWATCPRLDVAIDTGRRYGLFYRGVAFNWVKTRRDGAIIGAQGVPPTTTKPVTELCLAFTTCARGRPFPLLDSKVRQVVEAPRSRIHSEKPAIVRDSIVRLYGDRPRIELFARKLVPGWDAWGNEINVPESKG